MFSKSNLLLALLCLGVVAGCGKKKVALPAQPVSQADVAKAQSGLPPMPVATPREYLVNGQIDLNAISETLKEYVAWQQTIVNDPMVMVSNGFIKSLPAPPPGKKYFVDGMSGGTTVQLVLMSKEEMKQAKPDSKKQKP